MQICQDLQTASHASWFHVMILACWSHFTDLSLIFRLIISVHKQAFVWSIFCNILLTIKFVGQSIVQYILFYFILFSVTPLTAISLSSGKRQITLCRWESNSAQKKHVSGFSASHMKVSTAYIKATRCIGYSVTVTVPLYWVTLTGLRMHIYLSNGTTAPPLFKVEVQTCVFLPHFLYTNVWKL